VPLVVVVVAPGPPGTLGRPGGRRQRLTDLSEELARHLVHADDGAGRVVGSPVDGEHVLHLRHEPGVGLGGDHPLPAEVGLELVFLSTCRTVSWLSEATYPSSTMRPASSRMLQCERPSGGVVQAIWRRRASCSPSSARSYMRSGAFRSTAPTSPRSVK